MEGIYIANRAADDRERTRAINNIIENARIEGWNAHRAAIEQDKARRKAKRRLRIQHVTEFICGVGFVLLPWG